MIQHADHHLEIPEQGNGDPALFVQSLDAGLFDYLRPCDSVTGCCHLFRAKTLEKSGGFDIRLSPSQYDDLEHDFRLLKDGGYAVYQGHLQVLHRKRSGLASHTSPQSEGNALGNKFKLQAIHTNEELMELQLAGRKRLLDDIRAKSAHLGLMLDISGAFDKRAHGFYFPGQNSTGARLPGGTMHHDDETRDFLSKLPELKKGEKYRFKCYPGISCFNECCSDLNMVLTPYDLLRMRKNLGLSSTEVIKSFVDTFTAGESNFPALRLRMTDTPKKSCPFVRDSGCSIYPDRPGACRMYPLGRAAKIDKDGNVEEQFFVLHEDHCKGFDEAAEWNSLNWMEDQGFDDYIRFNDKYMHLISRWNETGRKLPEKLMGIVALALFQVDDFQQFIKDMRLFERVEVSEERQKAIMEDEEETLAFALDWVELLLLGQGGALKPRM